MENYSRYELEHAFANDFKSPLFPVLANLYYENQELQRALKVCKIGLKNDPNNYIGQYILSKTYIKLDRIIEAEKLLQSVVTHDTHNLDAILLLVEVKKKLKRSDKIINNYINYVKKITNEDEEKIKKQTKNPNTEKNINSSFTINSDMATKTMYNLLIKQKKYIMANNILSIMAKNKKNKKFVNAEMKKIEKHIINKGKV